MAFDGIKTVIAYCAVQNGKRERSMVGDSSFDRLRHMYFNNFKRPEQRAAILDVAEMMGNVSTDAREAIDAYWIQHPRSSKQKQVGLDLLRRLKR